jgi:hypothetical protein
MVGFSRRDAAKLLGVGVAAGSLGGWAVAKGATEADETLIPAGLDHVVWAVPDLDEGVALITELTGVEPVSGGKAPGRDLPHNALLSLGGGSYFEVFCPARTGMVGGWASSVADGVPHVVSYALHVKDRFKRLLKRVAETDLTHNDPRAMGRVRPDGGAVNWELMNIAGSSFDDVLPFYIDWLDSSPHPSKSSPPGVEIEKLIVAHPQADSVRDIYRSLGIHSQVIRSDRRSISVYLNSPKGKVLLT